MAPISPAQPWLLFHPPALSLPRQTLCPRTRLVPSQGRSENFPTPYTSLKGSGRGCPLLRASSDHCFIVGALRARRAPRRSPLPFFSILLSDTVSGRPHRHIRIERQVDFGRASST